VGAEGANEQLARYLKHRSTGRPWVVLKLARHAGRGNVGTGRDQSSGSPVRPPVPTPHGSGPNRNAVLVGAGTVRADDPSLTGPPGARGSLLSVSALNSRSGWSSGRAPAGAAVWPVLESTATWAGVDNSEVAGSCRFGGGRGHGGPRLPPVGSGRPVCLVIWRPPCSGETMPDALRRTRCTPLGELWRGRVLSVTSLEGDLGWN